MADWSLDDILGECGVDPTITASLVAGGWTIENFACVAPDEAALDPLRDDLVPG